ncbi:MAG: hypothetical protein D3906_01285 [Candidatus Electrothrix sp. AUS1_2]|nr:hypothetical protein [Candidatus Electrothrix sp. AUS1_2]
MTETLSKVVSGRFRICPTLYLCVPADIYRSFFESRFGRLAISKNRLRLIVCNIGKEEIEEWRN